ncbi:MAG: AbrB/MazE/SpoVT family DNA-binding domain-containing protein [Actinomycetota bacterium]|nr:AbrB/MazE/SpoVT family DNA-binding domain-containing protein [Actinomycetota bacterium]
MRVKLRKVGNSMTVTIPYEVVDELMLEEGTEVDIVVREDSVVIEPVAGTWEAMCERLRQQADANGITEQDVASAVEDERYGKSSE